MNISTRKDKTPLNSKYIESTDVLLKASNLLYEVINHSYVTSGCPLTIDINNKQWDIQGLYRECRDRLEQVEKGGERLLFLNMSVLEDTFKKVLPLLLVPMEEIANGDMTFPNNINELRSIFADNEYKAYWSKKAEDYKKLIENLGMSISTSDYEDLTLIMEPLIDAFTMYGEKKYRRAPKIMRVRNGERSSVSPELMTTVCKFSSAKEFVDALEQSEKEAIVAFGAVEQTERQTYDYFFEFLRDSESGRVFNLMRNDRKTKEEIFERTNAYSRVVYLGVKSKETIWLMEMPYSSDSGEPYQDSSDKYYYGKRAGYAPYEVFFKDIAAMPTGTTYLATKHLGYKLNEIMDDAQKVWLPAFLEETINTFFKNDVECEDYILPEEAYVRNSGYEIMPVFNTLPMTKTTVFDIPLPEEVFKDEPIYLELIRKFHVVPEDIKNAVMIENEIKNANKIKETIAGRSRMAYLRVIGNGIVSLMKDVQDVREAIILRLVDRKEIIIEEAKKGLYNDFLEVVVDKRHVLDENGEPKYKTEWRYGKEEKTPVLQHTEPNDAKWFEPRYNQGYLYNFVTWYDEKTSSKPPVVVKLRPWKKEHYMTLLGLKEEEMHDVLTYSEHITHFYKNNLGNMPRNKSFTSDYYLRNDTCYLPKLANVNICMKKNVWKKDWNLKNNKDLT